jgi:hypothetical protein
MALVTFLAGESIDRLNPVVVTSGGLVYKASALDPNTSYSTGIALNSGAVNSQIRVQTDDIISDFTGLTTGETYYLGTTSGTLASGYPAWETAVVNGFSNGAFLSSIGVALNSTSLDVEIERPIFVTTSGLL